MSNRAAQQKVATQRQMEAVATVKEKDGTIVREKNGQPKIDMSVLEYLDSDKAIVAEWIRRYGHKMPSMARFNDFRRSYFKREINLTKKV